VAKVTGQTPKVTLCYEAGYDGFWLARFLEQRGIECLVMEPASLQVTRISDSLAPASRWGLSLVSMLECLLSGADRTWRGGGRNFSS
jgi:hypothetical protein